MSANPLKQLTQEQVQNIQDVLAELSEASTSLDPERIKEARENFKKEFGL